MFSKPKFIQSLNHSTVSTTNKDSRGTNQVTVYIFYFLLFTYK